MSPGQKRTSQEDGTDPASAQGDRPPKKTKPSPSAGGDETTAALQRHLSEALDFINSCGLTSSTTPISHTTPGLRRTNPALSQKHPTPSSASWNPAPMLSRAWHSRSRPGYTTPGSHSAPIPQEGRLESTLLTSVLLNALIFRPSKGWRGSPASKACA